jgi:hypothetical protein
MRMMLGGVSAEVARVTLKSARAKRREKEKDARGRK